MKIRTKLPVILVGFGAILATVVATTIERIYTAPAAILALFGYLGVGLLVCGYLGHPIEEVKEGDKE